VTEPHPEQGSRPRPTPTAPPPIPPLDPALGGQVIHLIGYSHGALVCESEIRLAREELRGLGLSDPAIAERLHDHVTLETFNGASHDVDREVRAVHYVSCHDLLVGQSMGLARM
jgi:hypothetical protein